jgi:uncharacterized membrane protein
MLKFIVGYLATGLAFALVDSVWLTKVGPRLYRPTLDPVLADQFRLGPAIAFYLIYILGVMLLVVLPAAREGSWLKAATNGAILGGMAYATFDLTNQATLKVWTTQITVLDIGWGVVLTTAAATAGYFAVRWAARF